MAARARRARRDPSSERRSEAGGGLHDLLREGVEGGAQAVGVAGDGEDDHLIHARVASPSRPGLSGERDRVHGKEDKVREVPVKGGTLEEIRARLAHRGEDPGPLACPVRKGGRVVVERLSPQAVLRVCEKRVGEAGVEGFMPHDLRRAYISTLLDRGADLSIASELAATRAEGRSRSVVALGAVWTSGRDWTAVPEGRP